MKFDVTLPGGDFLRAGPLAREAEAMGCDGVWSTEGQHNPFLPLALALEHTRRVSLGTAIAVAFSRSPLVLAHMAWDLQRASRGRFILGLGTQVKAHIERRYSMKWESPSPKLKDAIRAIRAIWECWQHGTALNYRGEFYAHTLMTPAFNPGPIEAPAPPIYISAVNRENCRLVGELCDGIHIHPFHSVRYLKESVLPNVEAGLAEAGRARSEVSLVAPIFLITGRSTTEIREAREAVRRRIAFYASTRTYRAVLAAHGWEDLSAKLHPRSLAGDWDGMAELISDEMLQVYAVEAGPDEIGTALRARYEGLVDRLVPSLGGEHRWDAELFRELLRSVKEVA